MIPTWVSNQQSKGFPIQQRMTFSGSVFGLATIILMFANTSQAIAQAVIESETQFYSVSGTSGYEIGRSMKKNGPRSRLLRRRVWATTTRNLTYTFDTRMKSGVCRVHRHKVVMRITYRMPKVINRMTRRTSRTWSKMYQLIDIHEKVHGANYARLARDVYKTLESFPPEKSCAVLRQTVKMEVNRLKKLDTENNRKFDREDTRSYRAMSRLMSKRFNDS